jgi:hypothetical protein
MQRKIFLTVVAVIAMGWFGWHAVQFHRCGEQHCAPPPDQPELQLGSDRSVHLLATRTDHRGALEIEYLTAIDRDERGALCREAKQIWGALATRLDLERVTRAELLPTSPESEFLGMSYLVVPLYTCCVTTPLGVRRDVTGGWSFPDCPRE